MDASSLGERLQTHLQDHQQNVHSSLCPIADKHVPFSIEGHTGSVSVWSSRAADSPTSCSSFKLSAFFDPLPYLNEIIVTDGACEMFTRCLGALLGSERAACQLISLQCGC